MDTQPNATLTSAIIRAYAVPLQPLTGTSFGARAAAGLGFSSLLLQSGGADTFVGTDWSGVLSAFVAEARSSGLAPSIQLSLDEIGASHPLVQAAPSAFGFVRTPSASVIDPRWGQRRTDGSLCLRRPSDMTVRAWWREKLAWLRGLGFEYFSVTGVSRVAADLARALSSEGFVFQEHIIGLDQDDGKLEPKLVRKDDFEGVGQSREIYLLASIALVGRGWVFEAGAEARRESSVQAVNACLQRFPNAENLPIEYWTGAGADVQILSREYGAEALVLATNQTSRARDWPLPAMPALKWGRFGAIDGLSRGDKCLEPGATALFRGEIIPWVRASRGRDATIAADPQRRVIIGRVEPSVDGGRFDVKRVIGEALEVKADIFTDGHELLAAALYTRAVDEQGWTATQMEPVANDVWTAVTHFDRLGRHEFRVDAWIDAWGGLVRDFTRKREAGQDVTLEIQEAREFIAEVASDAPASVADSLRKVLRQLSESDPREQSDVILSMPLRDAMRLAAPPKFKASSFEQGVRVERRAAQFGSWYELFPRSQSNDGSRHGTFTDVSNALPHVAAMGFDVLYFPPIHPIGRTNRKGKNNTLIAAIDDVGSPYAIGASEGGHDSIHPALGTLEDFRSLCRAAAAYGLEIALDFAIQCAPDHPWLKEHPSWFAWRPDGTIKFAENPPKKYQDIVNVDFYAAGAVPDLWLALRDIVLFWIEQGIKLFRVDNPHTKPMPFWEWLIGDITGRYPDVLFLSEAFTRPKPMYHLAKVGFSQSYTYFTWRNQKAELTQYIEELAGTEVREFFRPHLFVNTPDINPAFLQTSGRAGFLIRAALAATLSGLWGVYSGFELCEAAALPEREEYLDSEKYQIRVRPRRAPGDIVDEIAVLNALRRMEPSLQDHKNVKFHNIKNDRMIYFSKSVWSHSQRLLVAISLDPFQEQAGEFEVPLWLFDLSDSQSVTVEDLLDHREFEWHGKMQHVRLGPSRPYAIWRIRPVGRS